MNSINFIKTLGPKQQHALARWYTVSIILTACSVLGILFIQSQQLYTLYTVHHQHATAHQQATPSMQLLKHHQQLKDQEHSIAQKQAAITSMTHAQRHMPTYLSTIIAATGAENLVSLTFNGTAFTMIVLCDDASTALKYIKQLQSAEHFTQIKLIALQPSTINGKQFTATIMTTIKNL